MNIHQIERIPLQDKHYHQAVNVFNSNIFETLTFLIKSTEHFTFFSANLDLSKPICLSKARDPHGSVEKNVVKLHYCRQEGNVRLLALARLAHRGTGNKGCIFFFFFRLRPWRRQRH